MYWWKKPLITAHELKEIFQLMQEYEIDSLKTEVIEVKKSRHNTINPAHERMPGAAPMEPKDPRLDFMGGLNGL